MSTLHTFVVAVIYALFVHRLPLQVHSWAKDGNTYYGVDALRGPLLCLLLIAAGWGMLVMVCNNLDVPWRWLRHLGIVQRSSRNSVWHDAFYEFGDLGYVQIELSDGRFVLGYVRLYSDEPNDPCLFLSDASWIGRAEGVEGKPSIVEIPGPGILLTKSSGIVNVAFLNAAK